MSIRVGIDLGTTFSVVAKIDEETGNPVVIKNSFGSSITPSVLSFESNGNILFGEEAKSMQSAGDKNTVAFFKRNIGHDMFSLDILGRTYNATDLSSIFLKKLIEEAEEQTGERIESAVITVPAYFTHKEREATIKAGEMAGIKVTSIINEPTSAAFAYGLNKHDKEQTVLIYDLGGGTFDVSIAKINDEKIEIIGSDGEHELGGKDWDDCIARYIAGEFQELYGIDLSDDEKMVQALIVKAEKVKKELTSKNAVVVPINYKGVKGKVTITEETFEEISQFLLETTQEITNRLLTSIEMNWSKIDGIILVGGSTRMRFIRSYVEKMSGKEPLYGVNVDEAVALGAAIRANITQDGQIIAALPNKKNSNYHDLRLQGAKSVTDVTAHSLGMISVNADGSKYINSIIIRKNKKIPASNTKSFKFKPRHKDNELEVYVLQGEFKTVLDNTIINKYVIHGVEKIEADETVIDVTYKYTSNGVIKVSAMQKENNKKLPIRIEEVPEDMSWADRSPHENVQNNNEIINVMLAIDLSGSMRGMPTQRAMTAMHDFVKQMDSTHTNIGVVAFADVSSVIIKPTNDFATLHKIIEKMPQVNVGVRNVGQPFTDCYEVFGDNVYENSTELNYIVVLTDGCWHEVERSIEEAKKCHQAKIEVMALGFGTADYEFLKKIASTEEFASITDLSKLGGSFSKIAQVISEGSAAVSII